MTLILVIYFIDEETIYMTLGFAMLFLTSGFSRLSGATASAIMFTGCLVLTW